MEHGIPYAVLTGRVVGPGEPLWLPDDLDMVLAHRAHEAERCRGCATFPWEWDEDLHARIGDVWVCQGCIVQAQERDNVSDLPEGQRPGAHPYLRHPTDDERALLADC